MLVLLVFGAVSAYCATVTLVAVDLNPPTIQWSKNYTYGTYGGIYSMTSTADGGYALGGSVTQLGTPGQTTSDMWLLKVDSQGNKQWEQGLSDAYLNLGQATSIIQADDGGYVITCQDLVKTDALGNVQWKRNYEGNSLSAVVITSDDQYAVVGSVHGGGFWLAKVDAAGSLLWSHAYGGSRDELAGSLVQTVDGGFVITGSTYSYITGSWDMWLVRTDSSGIMLWNQAYGTSKDDQGVGLVQTSEGGYMVAGTVDRTLCLVNFDLNGAMVWNKTINQVDDSLVHSIIGTKDGGYALAVTSGVVKIDLSGKLEWNLSRDGTHAIIQKGNDYVLAGSSSGTSPLSGWIASTASTQTMSSSTPQPSTTKNPTLPASTPTATQTPPNNQPTGQVLNQQTLIAVASTIIIIAVASVSLVYIKRHKSKIT
jgi:hypothetical protein